MCVTCGCGQTDKVRVEGETADEHEHVHVLPDGTRLVHRHDHGDTHEHAHDHPYSHEHEHPHAHALSPVIGVERARVLHMHAHAQGEPSASLRREQPAELVDLEVALLEKNRRIAERNRGWLAGRGVLALNMMSSPGAGKTSLLVRTLKDLLAEFPIAVVEGDQETSADADRIRATGARAVQINTGAGCHLEADMLERALGKLSPPNGSVVFIENVGNLVCPALFDLGERARVVVLSVTEGEDKPLKYPHMFRSADLMLLTKIDLLPYVDFDVERAEANARAINPRIQSLRVSVTSGEGLEHWYDRLRTLRGSHERETAS